MEKDYLNLLADVLQNGARKTDRTGTGTLSVFGRQLRFALAPFRAFNIVDGIVGGYGVEPVALSPACDFLYSEIWFANDTYGSLRDYIEQAGMDWDPARTLYMSAILGVGGFNLFWYIIPGGGAFAIVAVANGFSRRASVSRTYLAWVTMPMSMPGAMMNRSQPCSVSAESSGTGPNGMATVVKPALSACHRRPVPVREETRYQPVQELRDRTDI